MKYVMTCSRLRQLLHDGRSSNIVYFAHSYLLRIIPDGVLLARLHRELAKAADSSFRDYIQRRADYYNRLTTLENGDVFFHRSVTIRDLFMARQHGCRLRAVRHVDRFPSYLRLMLSDDDIYSVPDVPCLLKRRPIHGDNANSILLDMDGNSCPVSVKDKIPFPRKKDNAAFCGDCAGWDNKYTVPVKPEMSVYDRLKYRYVIVRSDKDASSDLKRIMSSNSIAVMPRPRFETWFMEGTLIPGYHYIEVKDDFSDVEEKFDYYSSHIDEALAIIKHANDYVAQFRDKRRERLVSLLVLDKYFSVTNSYKNIMNYEKHEL